LKRFSIICLAYFVLSSVLDVMPMLNLFPIKLGNLALIPPILYSVRALLLQFKLPISWFLILPLFVFMLPSFAINEFDLDKLTKLIIILFALSFTSPFVLNDKKSLRLFFYSLAFLGIVITIYSLLFKQEGYNRLVIADSNPIWISRYVSFGLFWFILLFFHKKIKSVYFILLLIPMLYVMVSTGSKGPLAALFLALLVLMTKFIRKPSLTKKTLLTVYLVCLLSIPVYFIFGDLLSPELERYTSFFTGTYEESERKMLYSLSFELISTHPLGIGIGKFAFYSPVFLYPHNIILEAFVEIGWIFGAYLILLLLACLFALLIRQNKELEEQALLGFFIIALTNSMFSGNMISPKELYITLPLALNVVAIGFRKSKSINKIKNYL
jgi:O-antigen ligase